MQRVHRHCRSNASQASPRTVLTNPVVSLARREKSHDPGSYIGGRSVRSHCRPSGWRRCRYGLSAPASSHPRPTFAAPTTSHYSYLPPNGPPSHHLLSPNPCLVSSIESLETPFWTLLLDSLSPRVHNKRPLSVHSGLASATGDSSI